MTNDGIYKPLSALLICMQGVFLCHFGMMLENSTAAEAPALDQPSTDIDNIHEPTNTFHSNGNVAIDNSLLQQKKVRVLIAGAGFGGLLFAVRLLQSGFLRATEILFVDAAGGFGGTWWNKYPGLACDIESYTYMPLLEETKYMPSQKYVNGPELREHANRIAGQWNLSERTLFQTVVNKLA